jgi:integrase
MIRLAKPYKDFPLTAHPNGQWVKKIRGKVHYFETDPQEALARYQEERDDLHAGRKPRARGNGTTLADLLNGFLNSKRLLKGSGELSPRSYADYEKTCDRIADILDKHRLLTDLGNDDYEQLRATLAKGRGPVTLKGELTRARMVFNYANESGLSEKPLLYRKAMRTPSNRLLRKIENERGPRMFERDEIRALIKAASPQLRAMIYLGINCGFGNTDCGTLPFSAVDLKHAWHRYWRPKTHNPRRCPLWPETVKALRAAIEDRPESDLPFVFLTRYRRCWCKYETGYNTLSTEFRKLLKAVGIYRENITAFYTLRRTFETIAATASEQVALDFIMGHCPAWMIWRPCIGKSSLMSRC